MAQALRSDPVDDVALDLIRTSRARLVFLDFLLEELEEANLVGRTRISDRVVCDLTRLGVDDVAGHSIPELIDQVFRLQEPVLKRLQSERSF